MALAVVAGNTLQVDAEKHARRADGELVETVLLIHEALVGLIDVIADEEIHRRVVVIGARRRGEQLAHKLVVGLIEQERIANVLIKEGLPFELEVVDAEQVGQEVCPLVEKWR